MSAPRTPAIWATKRDLTGPYVRCGEDDTIEVFLPETGMNGVLVNLGSRRESRLIAQRINECLDGTVKP